MTDSPNAVDHHGGVVGAQAVPPVNASSYHVEARRRADHGKTSRLAPRLHKLPPTWSFGKAMRNAHEHLSLTFSIESLYF